MFGFIFRFFLSFYFFFLPMENFLSYNYHERQFHRRLWTTPPPSSKYTNIEQIVGIGAACIFLSTHTYLVNSPIGKSFWVEHKSRLALQFALKSCRNRFRFEIECQKCTEYSPPPFCNVTVSLKCYVFVRRVPKIESTILLWLLFFFHLESWSIGTKFPN